VGGAEEAEQVKKLVGGAEEAEEEEEAAASEEAAAAEEEASAQSVTASTVRDLEHIIRMQRLGIAQLISPG